MSTVPTDPEEAPRVGGEDEYRKYLDIFAALAAPFEPHEVRQRTQGGRTFHYITARVAMNRLDDVVGPVNWWDEYVPGENSVLCKLSICLPDGHVLTKQDAGGYAGMADQGDDDKSGYSDSYKRAAVKFGVGRYLYRDGVPRFVRDREPGAMAEPRTAHPVEHVPDRRDAGPSQARHPARPDNGRPVNEGQRKPYDGPDKPPGSGKALFAWARRKGEETGGDVVGLVNSWGKHHGVKGKIVDWQGDDVTDAYAAVLEQFTAPAGSGRGDAHEEPGPY